MNIRNLFLLLFALLAISCTNDPDPVPVPDDYLNGVYILNEGQWGVGNGSISFYDTEKNTLYHEIFAGANGRPLGDVVQSMNIIDDEAWIVVNNSAKIEIVNPDDFKSVHTMSVFTSPRYLSSLGGGKAYLSDLYSGAVSVVNTTDRTVTESIDVDAWTEDIAFAGGKAFVAVAGRSSVWVIDPATNSLIDSIPTVEEPNSFAIDKNGKLWLLCTGGWEADIPVLYRIDPATLAIEASLNFSSNLESPFKLTLNGTGDKLYYLNNGIFEMDITATDIPSSAFANDHLFYGLGVDPVSGIVYGSDALDYTSNGWVYRYASSGAPLDSMQVGVSPGTFYFR